MKKILIISSLVFMASSCSDLNLVNDNSSDDKIKDFDYGNGKPPVSEIIKPTPGSGETSTPKDDAENNPEKNPEGGDSSTPEEIKPIPEGETGFIPSGEGTSKPKDQGPSESGGSEPESEKDKNPGTDVTPDIPKYTVKSFDKSNSNVDVSALNKNNFHTILYGLPNESNKYEMVYNGAGHPSGLQTVFSPINVNIALNSLVPRQNRTYNRINYSANFNKNIQNNHINEKAMAKAYAFKERLRENNKKIMEKMKPLKDLNSFNKNINYKIPPIPMDKVDNNDIRTFNEQDRNITATKQYTSNSAYYYVDNNVVGVTQKKLKKIADAFEAGRKIIVEKYAPESDVDGNGKVIFLITPIQDLDFVQHIGGGYSFGGIMGYFSLNDKYPTSYTVQEYRKEFDRIVNMTYENDSSNQADILYINSQMITIDTLFQKEFDSLAGTFLHEFQHMVQFDYRFIQNEINTDLDTWINEGLSLLAEYNSGYAKGHDGRVSHVFDFLNSGHSLTEWKSNNLAYNYGYSLLFMRYVYERFGDRFIKEIYKSKKTGIDAIEESIKNLGQNIDFNDLYTDFVTMILVSGRNITDDVRYNIKAFNHKKGTAEYNKNGFNLVDVIEQSFRKSNQTGVSDMKNNLNTTYALKPYGFQLTRWNSSFPREIVITNNTGVQGEVFGIYEALNITR